MTEYPIIFSGEMVRAILDGRKTMTRRVIKFPKRAYLPDMVIKPQPQGWDPQIETDGVTWTWCIAGDQDERIRCPYRIGQKLWAARLTLEVVSVRAERVQDISDEDIVKEGVGRYTFACGAASASDNPPDHRWAFIKLWDSINAKRGHGWHVNDWVWVVEFGMLP